MELITGGAVELASGETVELRAGGAVELRAGGAVEQWSSVNITSKWRNGRSEGVISTLWS